MGCTPQVERVDMIVTLLSDNQLRIILHSDNEGTAEAVDAVASPYSATSPGASLPRRASWALSR
jgi:hypothetical protein